MFMGGNVDKTGETPKIGETLQKQMYKKGETK